MMELYKSKFKSQLTFAKASAGAESQNNAGLVD
jgi:hypothetical protein